MTIPELDPVVWTLLGLLAAVQLGLLIAGLVTVLRTPAERLTAPRVVWALICFVQFVGPIVFFVAGRKPAPATPATAPNEPGRVVERVVAELYPSRP